MPKDSLHLDQVNYTLECFFSTDRNYDRTWICTQNILHLTNYFVEVSTRTVHLVYITDTWYVVLVSLAPYSFRLWFNTTYCTVSCNSTVQHTERTFYFSSKVHVSRGVNQVDLILVTIVVPRSSGSSRSNSDTTFLFLSHPVHGSCTIVSFTDLVSQTSVEQDTFRSCCLTGVDVSHDTDVTGQKQILFCHFFFL